MYHMSAIYHHLCRRGGSWRWRWRVATCAGVCLAIWSFDLVAPFIISNFAFFVSTTSGWRVEMEEKGIRNVEMPHWRKDSMAAELIQGP